MDNVFHENVSDDYIEYFLIDMLKSVELLNDALVCLTRETSDDSKRALDREISYLIEIINEESKMLNDLYDFRLITIAEQKIVEQIVKIRNSDHIKIYERVMR